MEVKLFCKKLHKIPAGVLEKKQNISKLNMQTIYNQAYEFWVHDMYMNVPTPLPVNSNPGWVFPKRTFTRPSDQAVYMARLVKGLLDFKEKIERYFWA